MSCCKTLLATLLFSMAPSVVNLMAQTASTQIQSTATVNSPLTGTTSSSLSFGVIPRGESTAVDPHSPDAGALFFSGDSEDEIVVTLPHEVLLTSSSGDGGSMAVELDLQQVLVNEADEQGSSSVVDFSSGSSAVRLGDDKKSDDVEDGLGRLYLWIGGSLQPSSAQQRGNYEGTFTVQATYSN